MKPPPDDRDDAPRLPGLRQWDDEWRAPRPNERRSPNARKGSSEEEEEAPPAPSKPAVQPRKLTRAGWRKLILFSMLALAFTALSWRYLHDGALPFDGDLVIPETAVDTNLPPASQRILALLGTVAPLSQADMDRGPPWNWETPPLSGILRANEAALVNLKDLIDEYDWQPEHPEWRRVDLGSHPAWAQLSLLKQAQAAYLARLGQEEAAFVALIDLAVLSRRLQGFWGFPSFSARSMEMHAGCCITLAQLLKETQLPPERLLAFQKEFDQCAPSTDALKVSMNGFYMLEKSLVLSPPTTNPDGSTLQRPGQLFFKPHQTIELFAQNFRELKDAVGVAPYARTDQVEGRVRSLAYAKSLFGGPNSGGSHYFAARMEPYLALPDRHTLERARHLIVSTLFAARSFRAEHKMLPPSLEALRPRYLPDVPADPFSSQPLGYDAQRGVISSVGTDLLSEGGTASETPLSDPLELTAEVSAHAAK